MELKANYYSGIKPNPNVSTVSLEAGQLRIVYENDGKQEIVIWNINQIKPDENPDDGKCILRYGKRHPFEYLEFDDKEAINQLYQVYPEKKWNQSDKSAIGKSMIFFISILAGILILGIALYFLFIPEIADALAKKVPVKWETELGEKMSKGILTTEKEDVVKSRMLDSFFVRMDVQSNYTIHFHFIKDSIVNAFAIPGGHIVIYKGLFDKMNSYESLAGLIGHEFSHVEQRHSLRTVFRSLSSFAILSAIFGDLTGVAGVLLQNANTIQNLSYSREFEHEADAGSVDILIKRKISLVGMLDLFNVFINDEKKGMAVPQFLSTHPVTEDRIAYIKSRMAQNEKELYQYLNLQGQFNRLKSD